MGYDNIHALPPTEVVRPRHFSLSLYYKLFATGGVDVINLYDVDGYVRIRNLCVNVA